MRIVERPFSDLLRRPNEVTKEANEADVILHRRQQPDLRITRADREAERSEAFAALARMLRNLAISSPQILEKALGEALPWLEFLPAKERRLFLDEFSRICSATGDLGNYTSLSQLIGEWKATAEVFSDPQLARRLKRPLRAAGDRVLKPTA